MCLTSHVKKIDRIRRLYEAAYNFEEDERVPVSVQAGLAALRFLPNLSGYTFKDYYRNLEVQRELRLEGQKWSYEVLDADISYHPSRAARADGEHIDPGIIREGVIWDCEIRLPDEEHPWTSPWTIPRVKTPEDIESIEVPDPVEVQEKFRKQLEKQFGRSFGALECARQASSIHPPFSAAGALMGMTTLCSHVYRYPKLLHSLLRKMFDTYCVLRDYYDEMRGGKTEALGLSDDHAGFLSERYYREFVLPYNKRLYERYGKKWRSLHMDSYMAHIAHIILDEYKVNAVNGRGVLNLAELKSLFNGKIVIVGSTISAGMLMPGFGYEKIKEAVDYSMREAAPGGGYIFSTVGETVYPGIDMERLLFLVRYAKKAGRYPINR